MSDYNKLKDKYAVLFTQHPQDPFTLFGFECGPGWYFLIENALRLISNRYFSAVRDLEYAKEKYEKGEQLMLYTSDKIKRLEVDLKNAKDNLPIIAQIKQKFSTLRIYVDKSNEYADGVIAMTESISESICEKCGNKGIPRGERWLYISCAECDKKLNVG